MYCYVNALVDVDDDAEDAEHVEEHVSVLGGPEVVDHG